MLKDIEISGGYRNVTYWVNTHNVKVVSIVPYEGYTGHYVVFYEEKNIKDNND